MTTPQHDDPFSDATTKVLQALAVLTTVGESVARFAAAGAQSRAAMTERLANIERTADSARAQADNAAQQAQRRADRQSMDRAFDEQWLANADLQTVATLWRTAAIYGLSGDRRAAQAMQKAETRLAALDPHLVDAYHRHRAEGRPIADAMNAAAHDAWQQHSRTGPVPAQDMADPHPTRPSPGHGGPDQPRPSDDLDDAAQAEIQRLAEGIDLDLARQLERQWRGTGKIPAADAIARLVDAARTTRADAALGGPLALPDAPLQHRQTGTPDSGLAAGSPTQPSPSAADLQADTAEQAHLTARAGQQLGRAVHDSAQPDLPATPVDEHRDGELASHVVRGRADQDLAAAAQRRRFGQAFPPLTGVTPTFSHAPVAAPSQPTTRRRGSTR